MRSNIKRFTGVSGGIRPCTGKLMLGVCLGFGVFELGLSPSRALSEDWPQWGRGTGRNMYSPAKGLPSEFGKIEFKQGTEEIDPKGAKHL